MKKRLSPAWIAADKALELYVFWRSKMRMSAELHQRIRCELKMLEHARDEYAKRLDKYDEYRGALLKRSRPGKRKYYYYGKWRGDKKYRYIEQSELKHVQKIRETRFLEEALGRIDNDISLLRSLCIGFLPYDPSSINESLHPVYRCEVPPVSKLYEHEGVKWKAGRLDFQKEFPENYPEKKRHKTSDGVMVKTISELTIYERFKAAGLAFVYELPLPPADYGPALYPDFTVLSPIDMKSHIIVEFAGRMDRQDYREDFARRTGRYIASGYTPGVNLFFIFSDNEGNIDSTQITKVIEDIFGDKKM